MNRFILIFLLTFSVLNTGYSQYNFSVPDWFRETRDLPLIDLDDDEVIYVSSYGAIVNDGLDDSLAIITALNAAKSKAKSTNHVRLVFDPGTYDLFPDGTDSHAIYFNNAKYVELDGTGAEIIMHNPQKGFLSMYGNQNVIVKGFEVDYNPLPFTQGVVLSVDQSAKKFTFKISDGFPLLTESYFSDAPEKWGMLKTVSGQIKDGSSNLININEVTQINADTFEISLVYTDHISQVEVNDYYVQIARNNGKTIFRSNSGKNITYLNTTSYSSPAGTYNTFSHEEWNLIDCKILLKPGRVHSANADCIHISGGLIGPWVQGCRFEGQSDDAVNMKYSSLTISSVVSPTEIVVSFGKPLLVGDTLSFYNPREGILLGRVGLVDTVHNLGGGSYRVFLSDPVYITDLSSDNSGDKAYLDTWSCESFIFRNDTIRNGRRYGLLLQNNYGIVEDCLFENLSGCGIRIENGVDWEEGFVAHDIEIKNNSFSNCGFDSKFNEEEYGATISAMISKLGDGNCNPWCGTAPSDWYGLKNITISGNSFNYNKASINFQNYNSKMLNDTLVQAGFSDIKIPLIDAFSEVLSENLNFSATSTNSDICTVAILTDTLIISSGTNSGSAVVEIEATNSNGGLVKSGFQIQVNGNLGTQRVFQGVANSVWSYAANWEDHSKPALGESAKIASTNSIVDEDYTLTQLSNDTGTSQAHISGLSTIILENEFGTSTPALLHQSSDGGRFTLDLPMEVYNSTNAFTYLGIDGSSDNILEFGQNSSITLNTRTITYTYSGDTSRLFEFNGALLGSQNLIFGSNTTNFFGPTSNNANYDADLVFWQNAKVTVETEDDSVFLPSGRKLQINGNNSRLILNGKNVVNGNISIASTNDLTIDVNADQANLKQVLLPDGGSLKLKIAPSVNEVFFEDNSSSDWGNGSVIIEGFKNGVIRFGYNQNGLSSSQLAQIEVNGQTGNIAINSSGYLYSTSNTTTSAISVNRVSPISLQTNESRILDLKDIFHTEDIEELVFQNKIRDLGIIDVSINDHFLLIEPLENGQTIIDLTAYKGHDSAWANIDVHVSDLLTVTEHQKIQVFPNPTYTDIVRIKSPEKITGTISVFDVLGNLYHSKQIMDEEIVNLNTSFFTAGIYLIEVQNTQSGQRDIVRLFKY